MRGLKMGLQGLLKAHFIRTSPPVFALDSCPT